MTVKELTTREIAGIPVSVDEDGFLTDMTVWNEAIAEELAHEVGIEALTDRHWVVINFSRADFVERGEVPTLRRLKVAAGVPTKELYQLFPKKPAKKIAYVSGLGKPHGCI